MALMDILLALVKTLCGGSTTGEQPSSEHQKQAHDAERPPRQEAITTRPEPWVPLEYHRQEQEQKPVSHPHVDHRPHQDQNQTNQHDEHYMILRAKANEEGDLMARCFQQSHEAYGQGDGARAKELSEQGKRHERTMETLNAEASAWIFRQNNSDSKPGEINLHGLYVKEATSCVEKCLQEARQRGDAEIRFIVGKGLHSDGHVAKIKPAIEELIKKHNIPAQVDSHNGGVLIAQLS